MECPTVQLQIYLLSPDGSTFLREMASWSCFKCDVKSKIRLRQSIHIYSKNTFAKFYSDLIGNDGALSFFEEIAPTRRRTSWTTTTWIAIWDQFLPYPKS